MQHCRILTASEAMLTRRDSLAIALTLLVTLGLLRGGLISIAKVVSVSGVPPFGYVFWQSFSASVFLIVVILLRGQAVTADKAFLRYYFVCAMLGIVLPNALFFHVVRTIPAGSMAVILTTVPLLTYAFALLLNIERANVLRAAGILTGFFGATLMAWPAGGDFANLNWHMLLGFLCPASYALTSVYASRTQLTVKDPMLLACGTLATAAIFSLPIALSLDQLHPIWRLGQTELLIIAHGAGSGIAFTLFFKLIKVAGPVFYSQSTYIIGLTGIGWGMLIFDERHGPIFWVATAFVLGGIMLVNQQQRAATQA